MNEEVSTERKQVFVGTIRKCPNCGAQITTDITKCPSCGFIIEKENVSSAMDEFVKKFTSIKTDVEKKEYIETYPVPNNKEDIRGFLNYASNQRDKDYSTKKEKVFWVDAWNNKCRVIVNQAIDFFGTDIEFSQYLKSFKTEVEKTSSDNKKLKRKLFFSKIVKISVVFVLVIGIIGFFIITENKKQKKRSELIAGCVVPKENVIINSKKATEILSDAKIITSAITQRVETESNESVWCLDTIVTVEIKYKRNNHDYLTQYCKDTNYWVPEYLNSNLFKDPWFRTERHENDIDCAYQSKSVIKHSFDNVHTISQKLLNKETENESETIQIRLTQIASSRKECEDLAIQLHKTGIFEFKMPAFYDQYYTDWRNNNL